MLREWGHHNLRDAWVGHGQKRLATTRIDRVDRTLLNLDT